MTDGPIVAMLGLSDVAIGGWFAIGGAIGGGVIGIVSGVVTSVYANRSAKAARLDEATERLATTIRTERKATYEAVLTEMFHLGAAARTFHDALEAPEGAQLLALPEVDFGLRALTYMHSSRPVLAKVWELFDEFGALMVPVQAVNEATAPARKERLTELKSAVDDFSAHVNELAILIHTEMTAMPT